MSLLRRDEISQREGKDRATALATSAATLSRNSKASRAPAYATSLGLGSGFSRSSTAPKTAAPSLRTFSTRKATRRTRLAYGVAVSWLNALRRRRIYTAAARGQTPRRVTRDEIHQPRGTARGRHKLQSHGPASRLYEGRSSTPTSKQGRQHRREPAW